MIGHAQMVRQTRNQCGGMDRKTAVLAQCPKVESEIAALQVEIPRRFQQGVGLGFSSTQIQGRQTRETRDTRLPKSRLLIQLLVEHLIIVWSAEGRR